MKSLKKILSIFAAFMMVVGLTMTSTSAAGETITVEDPNEGQTYNVYKIFNISYNATTNASSYTLADSKWESAFGENGVLAQFASVDGKGNVNLADSFNTEESAKEFASKALQFAQNNSITAVATKTATTAEATARSLTISVDGYGYYLITTTTGSLLTLNANTPSAIIKDKNNVPPVDKTITNNNDNSKFGVGDVINYSVKVDKTNGVATNVVVKDKMTTGLTFNNDISAKVVIKTTNDEGITSSTEQALNINTDYTVDTTGISPYTFKLTLTETGRGRLAQGDVVITYSATINSNALTNNSENNTVDLDFGNKSDATTDNVPTSKPTSLEIFKYTSNNNQETGLKGAEFTLTRTDVDTVNGDDSSTNQVISFIQEDGVYKKCNSETEGAVTTLTSGDNGMISITGLAEGTYKLIETKAPDGYNLLTQDITISVAADGVITLNPLSQTGISTNDTNTQLKVLNTTGAQLPSTGGMGTTMIYIAGAILMVGAAIIFVTNKRMKHE